MEKRVMQMPKRLEKKRNERAEKHYDENKALYEKKDAVAGVYELGFNACFEELTKDAGEFDEDAAYKFFHENLSDHDEVSLAMCGIEMARWQHQQSQARIEAINADRHVLDEANIKLNHEVIELRAKLQVARDCLKYLRVYARDQNDGKASDYITQTLKELGGKDE